MLEYWVVRGLIWRSPLPLTMSLVGEQVATLRGALGCWGGFLQGSTLALGFADGPLREHRFYQLKGLICTRS